MGGGLAAGATLSVLGSDLSLYCMDHRRWLERRVEEMENLKKCNEEINIIIRGRRGEREREEH